MRVVYTKKALESLDLILEFLQLQLPIEKVVEIRNSIVNATLQLEDFPLSGSLEPNLDHLNTEYRRIIISHYKVIYKVTNDVIYIMLIFDSRQDPKKMKL